ANTKVTNLQRDVFVFKASISGTVATTVNGPRGQQIVGLAGVTVQLNDEGGNVVATTTTDRFGNYSFNQQSGMSGTGTYSVSLILPKGYTQISPNPGKIVISRGDSD